MRIYEKISVSVFCGIFIFIIITNTTLSKVSIVHLISLLFSSLCIFYLNLFLAKSNFSNKKKIIYSACFLTIIIVVNHIIGMMDRKEFWLDWYYYKLSINENINRFGDLIYILLTLTTVYSFSLLYLLIKYKSKYYNLLTYIISGIFILLSVLLITDKIKSLGNKPTVTIRPDNTTVYKNDETFILNDIINKPEVKDKIKIIYFWTPSCSIFYSDIKAVNKYTQENQQIAELFIAGENSKCNAENWEEIISRNEFKGVHIFIPTHQMKNIYFDELHLNGVPGLLILSQTNDTIYKGNMREGKIYSRKRIEFENIINLHLK